MEYAIFIVTNGGTHYLVYVEDTRQAAESALSYLRATGNRVALLQRQKRAR